MGHHQFIYRDTEAKEAFAGTNFGGEESTEQGRRRLLSGCVLKLSCGYADGSTIKQICQELGALTTGHNPRLSARQWAYTEQARALRYQRQGLERIEEMANNGSDHIDIAKACTDALNA
jgi:hypothetical protein